VVGGVVCGGCGDVLSARVVDRLVSARLVVSARQQGLVRRRRRQSQLAGKSATSPVLMNDERDAE